VAAPHNQTSGRKDGIDPTCNIRIESDDRVGGLFGERREVVARRRYPNVTLNSRPKLN
jgi:hypothetical protein